PAAHGLIDSFVFFAPPTKQQVLLFDTLIFPRFHLDDQGASMADFAVLDRLRDAGVVRGLTLTDDDEEPWLGHEPGRDLWLRFPRGRGDDPVSAVRALRAAVAEAFGIEAVPVVRRPGDWTWAGP